MLALAMAAAAMTSAPGVEAHGAVNERIAALDLALQQAPNDAALYAKRGELHAIEEHWTQAVDDFEEAFAIDPEHRGLRQRLAEALLEVGDAERAESLASAALTREADAPAKLQLVRARARAALGQIDRADGDYRALFESAASPGIVREWAAMLDAADRPERALTVLKQGVAKLGPLVTLVQPAIELHERRGEPGEALAWLDRLAPNLQRSPHWLGRRAALLAQAGQREQAAAAYREALAALAALPPARRDAPAQRSLRASLERDVAALTPTPSPEPQPTSHAPKLLAMAALTLALLWAAFQRRRRSAEAASG
jgi:tetratricopeptide (TPR) repeat protein